MKLASDRCLLIDGQWYDLTSFKHPGGPLIDEFIGHDATLAFKLYHSLASDRPRAVLASLPRLGPGPAPKVSLAKLGGDFFQDLVAEVKMVLPKRVRSSGGFIVEVALVNYLLAVAALAFPPSVASIFCFFVMVGLLERSAEFCVHEGMHFRLGSHGQLENDLGMLVSNLCLHVCAPAYRSSHCQQHHVYTNQPMSKDLAGEDPDFADQLAVFPSSAAMWTFPFVRVAYNLVLWFVAPRLYALWKLGLFLWCTFQGCFPESPTTDSTQRSHGPTWQFCCAGFMVSLASFSLLAAVALFVGQWRLPDVILIASLSRGTIGFLLYYFLGMVTHLSAPMVTAEDPGHDLVLRQLVMTNDFATQSLAVSYLTNTLNNQATHHLFPQLPWQDCHAVAPVIAIVAAKHSLPYHNFDTFVAAAGSTVAAGDMLSQERCPRNSGWWHQVCMHAYRFEASMYALS